MQTRQTTLYICQMPSKNGSIFHEFMFIHDSMDHVSKNHRIVIWFSAANWFQNSSVLLLFTYVYVYCAQCGVLLMSTSHSTYCSIHSELFSFLCVCVSEKTLFRQISLGKFDVFQFRFKFMLTQWHVDFTWNCFCVILSQ